MKGILGRKIGMTQLFLNNGLLIPVTAIEVLPNLVLSIRLDDKDGYQATQLATEDKRENLVNKPTKGQFTKIKQTPKRFIKEIRNMTGYQPGDIITADIFKSGEIVDVSAVSKGKGFSGSIKRHNHQRGPMGHGSGYHRGVGSMGPVAPNRIFKNKKMPGHMGHQKVTVQNLAVVLVDIKNNCLLVKGSIPGPKKQLVTITLNTHCKKPLVAFDLLEREQPVVQPKQQSNQSISKETVKKTIISKEEVNQTISKEKPIVSDLSKTEENTTKTIKNEKNQSVIIKPIVNDKDKSELKTTTTDNSKKTNQEIKSINKVDKG